MSVAESIATFIDTNRRRPNTTACHFCGRPLAVPKGATALARACPKCRIMPTPESRERRWALQELRERDYE